MTIDFTRFTEETEEIFPIVKNIGVIHQRKVALRTEDGWYKGKVGNIVHDIKKASLLEIEKKTKSLKSFVGYPVGEDIVPLNFDNFYKKGHGETVRVNFLNEQPWDIVRFVEWEDGKFFSCGSDPKADRKIMKQVKEAFENNQPIDAIKGITPEIRYVFLLHRMQRDAFLAIKEMESLKLAEEERQKRIEEFRSTFSGRLQKTIEDAGGTLVRFSKKGSNYNVIWKIKDQKITSTIKDDFGIMELGYCASGYDKEHTLSSAVKLAQTYYEEGGVGHGGLYITRE